MTRENKLSIVIAFGLLIFVGMLVADHFSIASQRNVADLGSNINTSAFPNPEVLISPIPLPPRSNTNEGGDVVHVVQRGESLRTICLEFYGDSGLAKAISNWNNLPSADAIEIAQEIALPNRSALIELTINSTKNSSAPEPANTTAPTMGTYTVKSGDTLSEISQKVMGTSKKTQFLIDLNKDVMPNPNKISPGMVLQFPLSITQ